MRPMRVCAVLLTSLIAMHLGADEAADAIDKARHGDMFDQADVGTAFYFGNGVPQDYRQAYIWCAIAVESGMEDASERRDKAASKLSPEDLAAAQAEVAELLKTLSGE